MPRFKERQLQLVDLIGRFEANPSSTHVYDALAAIGRLKDDGAKFWDEDSQELRRWRESCDVLWTFLNSTLGQRRHLEKQDLATALREFIQEFEHSTGRMYQMLYSSSNDLDIERTLHWFDLVYRFSTYALISFWIDDKTEENSVKITTNTTTGKTTQEWTRNEMRVPKKHRRATKQLL